MEVLIKQFEDVTDLCPAKLPSRIGFFGYSALDSDADVAARVNNLFEAAEEKLGRIDGVVLPELALTRRQFQALRQKLPDDRFLISGVGEQGTNEVVLSFPPLEKVVQKKHHPWKLDEAQIIQYGLGGVLPPSREWWEYGNFTDRCLSFVTLSDLVLAALVCEDLARPDPVANLIRTVGPNLVIALLMDGPQLKDRWAARYATVLADDPGCSVLALTSIGMSEISRPLAGPNRSRVIALWKDPFHPSMEIELPLGYDAIAISVSTRYRAEFTSDGRKKDAPVPFLSGVHCIRAKEQSGALK